MKNTTHLQHIYAAILSYTGVILMIVGLLLLMPLTVLFFWPEEARHAPGFLLPAALLGGIGIALWRSFQRKEPAVLTVQEGGVIVLLSWVAACVFSAFPLMLTIKLNFTQAVFEAVSGYSTTGLSVVDVTTAPKMVLLWRTIMQFAGGSGFVIIMLSAIAGPAGPGLSIAEGRTDQLVPHVRHSAKLVLYIYAGYTLFGILALRLCGMNWFDAVNHAIPAVSTGGFSTRVESIGYWDSPAIEVVTMILMILGNLNFLTSYLLLRRKFKAFVSNGEVRVMTVMIVFGALLLWRFTCPALGLPMAKTVRVALFETVSALTTTGFSTVFYQKWDALGVFVLTTLMLVGGGTCSTAGAIKQYRIYLLYKTVIWEMTRFFKPRTAIVENAVWQGEQNVFVSDSHIKNVVAFVFLYLMTYFFGSGILMAYGFSTRDALFEFASSLGNVGLSIGITSATAPTGLLWTETIGMFLGRLEFFVIFVSIAKIIKDGAIFLQRPKF